MWRHPPCEWVVRQGLGQMQRDGNVRADLDPEAAALGLETVVLALLMGLLQAGLGDGASADARRIAALEILDAALRPPSEPGGR